MFIPDLNTNNQHTQKYSFVFTLSLFTILLYSCVRSPAGYRKINRPNNNEQKLTKSPLDIMKSFDLPALQDYTLNDDEKKFKEGLQFIADYNFDAAENTFYGILGSDFMEKSKIRLDICNGFFKFVPNNK